MPSGKYNSLPSKEYNFPQGKYNLPSGKYNSKTYTPRALGRREVHFCDAFPSSLRSSSHSKKRKRAPTYTAPGSVISHKTCHLADFIRHRRTSSQSDFIYGVDFIKNELKPYFISLRLNSCNIVAIHCKRVPRLLKPEQYYSSTASGSRCGLGHTRGKGYSIVF